MTRITLTGTPSKTTPAHIHTTFHGTCPVCQQERMTRYARQELDARIAAANWAAHAGPITSGYPPSTQIGRKQNVQPLEGR